MSRPFLSPEVRAVHPVGATLTDAEYASLRAYAASRAAPGRPLNLARALRELAVDRLKEIEEKERIGLDENNGKGL